MSARPLRLTAVPAALVLVLIGGTVPAAAGAAEPAWTADPVRAADPVPGLVLTLSEVPHSSTREVLLSCFPVEGSHPHGVEACAVLVHSGGDLDALAVTAHPCTREYHPVAVAATGAWAGRPVHWERTFSNPCVLDSATGPVFRF
ncbi:SSI family serine proteinase inhibitor [Streptomyces meridianus]|uniref:SSI family serine proteinase inhibitor n=1 Tax=Streptomyces meridianus TaxID=2938945 RepID=A0ABT0X8Y7_9ACTN|nr:SSI family serine proteinase inhibitor [Streptomyces meridianus]MCM2578993.1 SSI family serine proteinase inhibitor [Streptomyces meridianus]